KGILPLDIGPDLIAEISGDKDHMLRMKGRNAVQHMTEDRLARDIYQWFRPAPCLGTKPGAEACCRNNYLHALVLSDRISKADLNPSSSPPIRATLSGPMTGEVATAAPAIPAAPDGLRRSSESVAGWEPRTHPHRPGKPDTDRVRA